MRLKRLLVGLMAVLALACSAEITMSYNSYVGIVGAFELHTVNAKPLSSDTGIFLDARYVLDSGRVAFTDSTFRYTIHYTIIQPTAVTPATNVIEGAYRVAGDNVRFYPRYADVFNAAFLYGNTLIEVWGDGHTLVWLKR